MRLFQELKKPFNLITFILTIFSIALSFYFYYAAEKEKSISYCVFNPSSLIFDSNKATSTIKIVEKDSVIISQNIYLISGLIWNSGDYPIEKSDVRKQISISLSRNSRILDFKIVNQKEGEISKFILEKVSPSQLALNWNYFDPGYGFKYQIIYTDTKAMTPVLSGKILDISKFKEISAEATKNDFSGRRKWLIGLPIFIVIMLGLLVWQKKRRKRIEYEPILYASIAFVMLLLMLYVTYIREYPPQL